MIIHSTTKRKRLYSCTVCGKVRTFETSHSGEVYFECRKCGTMVSVYKLIEEPDTEIPESWNIKPGQTVEQIKENGSFKTLVFEVCHAYKVTKEQVFTKTKTAHIAEARQVIAYNLRYYGFTSKICASVVNLCHASVLHSCKEIEARIETKQLLI